MERDGWLALDVRQWHPAICLAFAVLLFGIPESPRWLVEMGRAEQAKTILAKVAGGGVCARLS